MPDENMTPKVRHAMRVAIAWMREQMYENRTKWTYGNEHDRMRECFDLLEELADADRA